MFPYLRKALVEAQEKEPQIGHMKVLITNEDKKLTEKLYCSKFGTENMSKFPLFMAKLDELIYSMGGRPYADQEESEAEDDDDAEEKSPEQASEKEDDDGED